MTLSALKSTLGAPQALSTNPRASKISVHTHIPYLTLPYPPPLSFLYLTIQLLDFYSITANQSCPNLSAIRKSIFRLHRKSDPGKEAVRLPLNHVVRLRTLLPTMHPSPLTLSSQVLLVSKKAGLTDPTLLISLVSWTI